MWLKRIFWKMEDFAARAVQEFLLESVRSITRHIMPARAVQEFTDKNKGGLEVYNFLILM